MLTLTVILSVSAIIYSHSLDVIPLTMHECFPPNIPSRTAHALSGSFESNGLFFYYTESLLFKYYKIDTLYDLHFCRRIISLLSALISIGSIFYLGYLLKDYRTGLLAAFMLASNNYFIGVAVHGRF